MKYLNYSHCQPLGRKVAKLSKRKEDENSNRQPSSRKVAKWS